MAFLHTLTGEYQGRPLAPDSGLMTGPIWRLVPILAGLLLALTTSSRAA